MKHKLILLICLCPLAAMAQKGKKVPVKADAVYYNARVYTLKDSQDIQQAFAVKNGKFVKTGSNQAILGTYTSAVKVDLKGKAVFPGFIDAHCHFYGYGLGLLQVNLAGTKSWDETLYVFSKFYENSNAGWLIGRGWDQNDWAIKEFPDNKLLNSLYPDKPVVLKRIDGHAVIANNKALELAGITRFTKVEGGEIVLKDNQPTGVLVDNAVDLLDKVIPKPGTDDITNALLKAQSNCFAAGLTTVDDAGLDRAVVNQVDSLQKAGRLKINIYAMLNPTEENFAMAKQRGVYETQWLTVRSFKLYTDGALGSRGALLKQEYCDQKEHFGLKLQPQSYFDSTCKHIAALGYQCCSHAIGDSANSMILKAYMPYANTMTVLPGHEKDLKKVYNLTSRRWRVEHAQVIDLNDQSVSFDGIIPSVQPTHATSDMYWAKDRLCESRMPGAYAYRTLLQRSGGFIALGTDFPVEDISPVKTFYAAVFRKDANGFPEEGFQMENALSRWQTLMGMTKWAAYSNFEENKKGSIEAGKQADFIVLDTDIMTAPGEAVLNTKVLKTVVHGEVVYEKKP